MQHIWFQGIPKKEQEQRKKDLRSYRAAFEALSEILDLIEEDESETDYDSPSWAYKQADRNGGRRMLKRVRKLIDINEG